MIDSVYYILCIVLAGLVLLGISMMSKVKTALWGNLLSCACMAAAIVLTIVRYDFSGKWLWLLVGLVPAAIAGAILAKRVKMIEMPQTVAMLNGFGGAASALVAAVTLTDGKVIGAFEAATAGIALIIGMVTLLGSILAAGKLAKWFNQRPVILKGHTGLVLICGILAVLCVLPLVTCQGDNGKLILFTLLCAALAGAFGWLFVLRVGGADMPITISLLNSLSGVAGGIAGMAIGEPLLVAVGGIVGASGLILTEVMCRAMNRKLSAILTGATTVSAAPKAAEPAPVEAEKEEAPVEEAAPVVDKAAEEQKVFDAFKAAKNVIIVPGYGMALSQAQYAVRELKDALEAHGAKVRFAIHPVAGRMPGHMNVLLCEVDIPYEDLFQMEDINDDFKDADVTLVIGANDVMNPAANTAEGTPIYGMPVLNVGDCKNVVICNFDLNPGYAGVPNPLYERTEGVALLIGDAKESLTKLKEML
ncbi:MAG: NAD(P)(+) transhydrogenase (Re/Si-specific) subunit beta [Clostridia bacterium]|nr:NAD(P)(+) transhydrogenase (Re/Si-specific) subunit beta [Clostridia bacterium]